MSENHRRGRGGDRGHCESCRRSLYCYGRDRPWDPRLRPSGWSQIAASLSHHLSGVHPAFPLNYCAKSNIVQKIGSHTKMGEECFIKNPIELQSPELRSSSRGQGNCARYVELCRPRQPPVGPSAWSTRRDVAPIGGLKPT